MLDLVFHKQFKKDFKRIVRRGKQQHKLLGVVDRLRSGDELPAMFREHRLVGDFNGCLECHFEPDWLMIYRIDAGALFLLRTGSHADLFA